MDNICWSTLGCHQSFRQSIKGPESNAKTINENNHPFIVNLNYFSLFGLNMKYNHRSKARMAELADALDSKSSIFGCGGSTPPPGTFYIQKNSLSRMVT